MSKTAVTRITHSCHLIEIGGRIFLTDPWFSTKPGYYQGEPIALGVPDLPRLDGEGHPVQGHGRAEVLAQAGDFDSCFHTGQTREQQAARSSRCRGVFGVAGGGKYAAAHPPRGGRRYAWPGGRHPGRRRRQ